VDKLVLEAEIGVEVGGKAIVSYAVDVGSTVHVCSSPRTFPILSSSSSSSRLDPLAKTNHRSVGADDFIQSEVCRILVVLLALPVIVSWFVAER
jgi:hypothetical protein